MSEKKWNLKKNKNKNVDRFTLQQLKGYGGSCLRLCIFMGVSCPCGSPEENEGS